jgi:hypothetical protein
MEGCVFNSSLKIRRVALAVEPIKKFVPPVYSGTVNVIMMDIAERYQVTRLITASFSVVLDMVKL